MKAVIQRVSYSSCRVDGELISEIDKGLNVLLGVEEGDSEEDLEYLALKISKMRIFEDSEGKMNLSIQDINGEILLISQFTLLADTKKGNRPSFTRAGKPDFANEMYKLFQARLEKENIPTKMGVFGADMKIQINNDGPVTIIIDSKNR